MQGAGQLHHAPQVLDQHRPEPPLEEMSANPVGFIKRAAIGELQPTEKDDQKGRLVRTEFSKGDLVPLRYVLIRHFQMTAALSLSIFAQ